MATSINWPSSPSVNDLYTFGALTFQCVGVAPNVWRLVPNAGQLASVFVLLQGPFMTALVTGFPMNFGGGPTPNFTLLTHI